MSDDAARDVRVAVETQDEAFRQAEIEKLKAALAPAAGGSGSGGCPEHRREVTLPSGRIAWVLKKITGRHLGLAGRVVGPQDQTNLHFGTMAMMSVACLIDGKPMTYEEIQALDSCDVYAMTGLGMGKEDASPKST